MRRQAGAVAVDFDMRGSTARYAVTKPRSFDFKSIARAVDGAAYSILKIELETEGHAVRKHCDKCQDDRLFWKIAPTGQEIELDGTIETGRRLRLRGTVSGRDDGHLRLKSSRVVPTP